MSKYISIVIAVFFISTNFVLGQNSLQIEISNLRNSDGFLSLELLSANNVSLEGKSVEIVEGKCVVTFEDLDEGSYAIRYFHDENSNQELDTNFLGIPKEGIGFSNDAYGRFGPKDFEEWLFEVKGSTKIILTTTYY